MKYFRHLALLSCLFFPCLSFSSTYQWVDENGVTNFSQNPPASGAFTVIDTGENYLGKQNQVPASLATPTPSPSSTQPAPAEQQLVDIVNTTNVSKETCEQLSDEINRLKTLPRIRLKSGGTYTRLSDDEKWAMIEEREQWYEKNCK